MFETETVGPFLVWELKWGGGHAPLSPPPSGYAPAEGLLLINRLFIKKSLFRYLQPSQTFVMEHFEAPSLDVWQCPKYDSL